MDSCTLLADNNRQVQLYGALLCYVSLKLLLQKIAMSQDCPIHALELGRAADLFHKLLHCLPCLLEGWVQLASVPQVTPLVTIAILLVSCEWPVNLQNVHVWCADTREGAWVKLPLRAQEARFDVCKGCSSSKSGKRGGPECDCEGCARCKAKSMSLKFPKLAQVMSERGRLEPELKRCPRAQTQRLDAISSSVDRTKKQSMYSRPRSLRVFLNAGSTRSAR